MKKIVLVLSLGAMVGGVLASGCSKSKNAASSRSGAGSAMAGGPTEMRIKWTTGKKYMMRMEFNQGTETQVPNQTQPMNVEVKLTQDFNFSALKDLDNGGKQLELEFVSEALDVSQGGRKVVSFDSTQSSAADTNNPTAAILGAMVGAHVDYFTDADGKVQKVEGVDDLMKRIEAVAKPQQQAMFKQMFSEDTLKQYGSFGELMPNRSVNIGESWPIKRDITSAIGALAVDINYTFKDWEQHGDRKCAHIEFRGDISSKGVSTASGAAVEIEKGKVSGDIWFDPELGMIVDMDNDQTMTMKVTTRTQTMTPRLTQKIHLTLVDVE